MYYATLTRRKWRCDNATMYQCVTVTFTQWKNHSHKHGYHQEQRSNENKNRKSEEKEEEQQQQQQQQQQPRRRRRRRRHNQPTNEGPMKGQKQVKHTHQIQCQLSFKKQTKTQTVESGVWQYKKELTHLNIKTIIAITTWTKMGAHSKSWIMTHDA